MLIQSYYLGLCRMCLGHEYYNDDKIIHFNDRKGEMVGLQKPSLRALDFLLCLAMYGCGHWWARARQIDMTRKCSRDHLSAI